MNRFIVLMYHEILGPSGFAGRQGQPVRVASGYQDVLPPPLHVHEADFAAQMDFLAREGWHVMDLGDLLAVYGMPSDKPAAPGSGWRLPERSVLISFDDLYQSQADLAVPILRRHGFKALGFACATWLFDIIQPRSNTQPVCLSWPELPTLSDTLTVCNHSQALHSRNAEGSAIERLVSLAAAKPGDKTSQSAVIGDTLAAEALTGGSGIYAWPFGAAPQAAEAWLREAGIRLAFTTQAGTNDSRTPALRLKRNLVPLGLDLAGFSKILQS